jgi:hypothetical protein
LGEKRKGHGADLGGREKSEKAWLAGSIYERYPVGTGFAPKKAVSLVLRKAFFHMLSTTYPRFFHGG